MSAYHNLAGIVPDKVARCIRDMEAQIFSLQSELAKLKANPPTVSDKQVKDVLDKSGLIGALAQPLIGDPNVNDPQLTSIGSGNVSSVAATGDSNISVGGSPITTSGTITITFSANPTATTYRVSGTQVVSSRKTGWTAATGTATRTTFDTTTVTLPQLAERVKALIDDLISHGLIGA